jgi:NodT family efflux transporter outer membrane factor (OMF) lipoprotein
MKRVSQHNGTGIAGLILLSAMFGGCLSAGPDYAPPQTDTPQQWQNLNTSAAADTALRRNGETVSMLEGFALFQEESLTRLQESALANNQDLQVALVRFAQSRLQRGAVGGQSQPQLAASGAASRQRQSETGSATRLISAISGPNQSQDLIDFISDPFALYQAGFDASWEPDLWGRVSRSIEAADARVDLAGASLAQWQLGLMAEVARHYFELRGTQNQALLLQQDIARNAQILDLLEARERAGLDNAVERERQQIILAELRTKEAPLQQQQKGSLNALSLLLGQTPGSLNGELSSTQAWSIADMPDLALGIPSDVVNTRPDIKASEARLREATAQIGIAKADLYPRITLGAGLGLESLQSGELADWGSRQWSIGPRFSLPLFDQGRRKTNVLLHELQQQEAAIAYQQVVLSAWHEVDNALSRYSAEREQREALQNKLFHQQQALALAQASYRNGMSNYLVALNLEQAVANVQRELMQSDTRLALNLVGLFKSLGRSGPIEQVPLRPVP